MPKSRGLLGKTGPGQINPRAFLVGFGVTAYPERSVYTHYLQELKQ